MKCPSIAQDDQSGLRSPHAKSDLTAEQKEVPHGSEQT